MSTSLCLIKQLIPSSLHLLATNYQSKAFQTISSPSLQSLLHQFQALTSSHRFSKYSTWYQHVSEPDNFVIVDLWTDDEQNAPVVVYQLYLMFTDTFINTFNLVNCSIPINLSCHSPILSSVFNQCLHVQYNQSASLVADLYQLNSERLFNLFKKVVGDSNKEIVHKYFYNNKQNYTNDTDIYILQHIQGHYLQQKSSEQVRLQNRLDIFQSFFKDKLSHKHHYKLLDYGGGSGEFAAALQQLYQFDVTNVDVNNWLSLQHEYKHQNITYNFITDINIPSVDDASMDVVCMMQVLHHLSQPDATLQEIHRILKVKGYLFLREHDCQTLEDQLVIDLEHLIYEISYRNNIDASYNYSAKYWSKRCLYKLLSNLGFHFVADDKPKGISCCYYSLWQKL